VETIRRQREVVSVLIELWSRGFGDVESNDNRVSRKVRDLLEVSQWSSAFSVAPCGVVKSSNAAMSEDKGGLLCIRKKHIDARLDLSGISKGWAVDEIASKLPSPCYVEWGGDIKVRGQHPSGRPWIIAVPEPPTLDELHKRLASAQKAGQKGPVYTLSDHEQKDDDDNDDNSNSKKYLAILELQDGDAVATSGDYEKIIYKEGKMYSHVINPQLGRLLQLNQVTLAQSVVVCKSCMFADALATAAMSREDISSARTLLEPFRTGFREPVTDFILYARRGPRIVRMLVPGLEQKEDRERRLARHTPAKVIVVGSGLAGMSAAIEAADAGASVIILEKESKTGGNSAKATSGISGWGTETQARQGVADEERLFERDTFLSGLGGQSTPSLVRTLSTKSAPAIHWLLHRFNIPLTVLSQLGGHSAKRTHRAPPDENGRPVPIGFFIMKTLRDAVENEYKGNIEIKCGHSVTSLIHKVDEHNVKTVTGVQVKTEGEIREINADAVVLATGGFGCSLSEDGLMARFRPDLIKCPTTNGAFAQGDGVTIAESIGAELIDMDKVQLHPTGFIDPKDPSNPTKYLAPEAIRGSGGIMVNDEGKRFVNELDLRSVVAKAIQNHCAPYKDGDYTGPPFAWCILSEPAQKLFGAPVIDFYKNRLGLLEHCADVKAAASLIGCSEGTLIKTLKSYEEAAQVGNCPTTQKDIFPAMITPDSQNLILCRVTPSIHYTMGGININAAGEVQERIESIVGHHRHIRRLFAAGEVTGGLHGNNRLAGNSLLECVVFGRIAGERAATIDTPSEVMFPYTESDTHLKDESTGWFSVVLREMRNTDKKYGINTREARFNLDGSLQCTGLDIGQYVAVRGEIDGETLMGYFSPITRPTDEGVIGILCRVDARGGPITKLLQHIRPGSTIQMRAMGGLRIKFHPKPNPHITFRGKTIRHIGLLAGGTGIAPMLQIIRAYGNFVLQNGPDAVTPHGLNLIYAAEEESDLAYMKILETLRDTFPLHFRFYVVLNRPPTGWYQGVGFIEPMDIRKRLVYPPTDEDMVVMCGPPVFEMAMRKTLFHLGFNSSQWFSFAADDNISAHL